MLAPDTSSMVLADWKALDRDGLSGRKRTRAAIWALPVSVALHAALLLVMAWSAEHFHNPPPPEALPMEIVSLATPEPVPPPPEPVKKPEPPQPKTEVKPVPLPEPIPSAVRRASPPVASAVATEPAAEILGTEPVAAAAPSWSSPAVESTASPDQMGPYLAEVRRKLQAHLDYPFAARRMKLAGIVHVRLHVATDGMVEGRSVMVVVSSGLDILDEAGLVTVRRAAPFPPPPGGRALVINVPVVFELRRG